MKWGAIAAAVFATAASIGLLGYRRPRQRVVAAALGELGKSDPAPYWRSSGVLGPPPSEWCGAFSLWALHRAGLARDTMWKIGSGYLSQLPRTTVPKPGDIAYLDKPNQHHAVVVGVRGDLIDVVNGNGVGRRVTRSTITLGRPGVVFFSIEGLA